MSPILHIRKNIFDVKQAEFALLARVSQATVSRWEKGEWEPNRTNLQNIRNAAIERGIAWDDRWFFEHHDLPVSRGEAA